MNVYNLPIRLLYTSSPTSTYEPLFLFNQHFGPQLFNCVSTLIFDQLMMQLNRPLISIAPMLDITNRHFRFLMRLLTTKATLYTQMIHQNAVVMSSTKQDLIGFDPVEHPLVLQLGGSDPDQLAEACKVASQFKYDQINLNVGCPSRRVQKGSFGACLMKESKLVGQCLKGMNAATDIKCTVKCRIGVDDFDSYQFLSDFISQVSLTGNVNHFIIHARKAFLKGLNPAENRRIPPLNYEYVYRLKKDFPDLNFTINGGIKTLKQAQEMLATEAVNGCMIGRTAYENPWELATLDQLIYQSPSNNYSRRQVLELYGEYVDGVIERNPTIAIHCLTRPIMNFFNGQNNNNKYRQFLTNKNLVQDCNSFSGALQEAMQLVREANQGMLERRKYDVLS